MGKGGFNIIESFAGVKTAAENWLSSDFTLPDDYPSNLLTFLHLSFDLDISSVISIIKNGTTYPLNNNEAIIGDGFRSIPIIKGISYNFSCIVGQSTMKFTAALEQ